MAIHVWVFGVRLSQVAPHFPGALRHCHSIPAVSPNVPKPFQLKASGCFKDVVQSS